MEKIFSAWQIDASKKFLVKKVISFEKKDNGSTQIKTEEKEITTMPCMEKIFSAWQMVASKKFLIKKTIPLEKRG